MSILSTLEARLGEDADMLRLALVYSSSATLLPELLEIFGKDVLLKFLDIFSGTTVEVPSVARIEDAIRDVRVYRAVEQMRAGCRGAMKKAQDDYGLSRDAVRAIHRRVSQTLRCSGVLAMVQAAPPGEGT